MPRHLPAEFDLSHDVCFVLHDFLSELVDEGERAGLLFFKVEPTDPRHLEAMEKLEGEDLWLWFQQHGYHHVLEEFTYRHLVIALTSDFCHFVYEGLRCSEKGKLTVAFSSLRKPLQDNLFYLEWMLADWPGFWAKYQIGPDKIDPSQFSKDSKKDTRLKTIQSAMNRTPAGTWIDPEWIYEMRYEKATDIGLDPLFNQSVHLVTTSKTYATPPGNINFIFCDQEDREELWHQLYALLPAVLFNALHVVRALFRSLDPTFTPRDPVAGVWLTAGFWLATRSMIGSSNGSATEPRPAEFMTDLVVSCPNCRTLAKIKPNAFLRFWRHGDVHCWNCKSFVPVIDPIQIDRSG